MSNLKKQLRPEIKTYIDYVISRYGPIVTRKQIMAVSKERNAIKEGEHILYLVKPFKLSRGQYSLTNLLKENDLFSPVLVDNGGALMVE